MPAAEQDVTADLVRTLLAAQHPDLAGLPLTPLANGWDNVVLRLGEDLAVRVPRREVAAGILRNEQRWLPVLAPRLPLPVPAPLRIGEPGPDFPWPWSVVRFLPGAPAADTPPADFRQAAADIGTFLGALHRPAEDDAPTPDIPVNPVRGVPLARRAETFAENLAVIAAETAVDTTVDTIGAAIDTAAIQSRWDAALATPEWDGPPLWLHGDPHPANILVAEGRISAVIDFGDITAGDPATDLSLAWMLLPTDHHAEFRAAYGEAGGAPALSTDPDDPLWRRARGWALNFAVVFLAHSADNSQLRAVGRRTLASVLADDGG